jgi:hypothetical protein
VQDTKERSPKKLKKKQDSQKDKKGWFLQKHRIEEPRNESLTITIKYKYDENLKQNKYANKNLKEI